MRSDLIVEEVLELLLGLYFDTLFWCDITWLAHEDGGEGFGRLAHFNDFAALRLEVFFGVQVLMAIRKIVQFVL